MRFPTSFVRGTVVTLDRAEFAALDFETANQNPATICQVGIATVGRGRVTNVWTQLIRPKGPFAELHTRLHGLDAAAVDRAPPFGAMYPALTSRLPSIVATHTRFDIGALVQACVSERLPVPRRTWLDSARVARLAWPRYFRRGQCALAQIAAHVGIQYRAHDAGEDARAAAEIILAAQAALGISTWELVAHLGTPTIGRRKQLRQGPSATRA